MQIPSGPSTLYFKEMPEDGERILEYGSNLGKIRFRV